MKTYLIALLCALINSVCAEDTVPLGLWIVETKPFPDSVPVDVKELQFFGYCRTEPNIRIASLAAVNTKNVPVHCQMVEGRHSDMDYVKTTFEVRFKLDSKPKKELWDLLTENVGKRILLRLGEKNICYGQIVKVPSPKNPNTLHTAISGRWYWTLISADEINDDITLCYQDNDHAMAMRESLQKLVKPRTEQPGAGQPATQPADKDPAKDQLSTPTSKDAPR
jgi:hypothetical protein